ncbi:hypothetical protein FSARC_13645 [Fusarium sarcochroum]|uniref:SGNH hydrolase-type esterase domain-containing protein n=1 Tax=Fusarium sarcochroum TaxID=1208366 RepID=A0A8H4T075_9HYPO|nr:hypothetical protein FSARC_13645 [Fusarium sarcochroum]
MPQEVELGNLAPPPFGGENAMSQFENSTLRQTFQMSIGAETIRIRISNTFGQTDLPITAASVAYPAQGSAGVGQIETATSRQLRFNGSASVIVPPGEIAYSDPIDIMVSPLSNIALSLYTERGQLGSKITGHPGSRTTSWMQTGEHVNASSISETSTLHWYFATGIDVLAPTDHFSVVLLGDSITDGRGSDDDGNTRWSDFLAANLQNSGMLHVAVNNQAAGGNAVLKGGLGPPLLQRFRRDALQQAGVRYVLVFEGVNDIGASSPEDLTQKQLKDSLIRAYSDIVAECKSRRLVAIGATITPFSGNQYGHPRREITRLQINKWILNSGTFDYTVDFSSIIGDGDKLLQEV